MVTRPNTLYLEPGSRLFRVRDRKGKLHALSSYLLQEAESGDGVLFPEDLADNTQLPDIVEVRPWMAAGGIGDFAQARLYMGLLRKRFSALFRRPKWQIVLSPAQHQTQLVVWEALLREAGFGGVSYCVNLEGLATRETGDTVALFFHWGASGGDLGACLHQELLSYQRVNEGEAWLVKSYQEALTLERGVCLDSEEVQRLLRLVCLAGLDLESSQLAEVRVGEQRQSWLLSEELSRVLALLRQVIDQVLDFVRGMDPRDQSELFQAGLQLSGGSVALPLLREALQGLLEVPVSTLPDPARAVLSSPRFLDL